MDDLAGRTILVTGANTGIGFATARALAGRGARVHLACRSRAQGQAATERIIAETANTAVAFLPLDLGDLATVRECARMLRERGEPLHAIVNNAGVAGSRGLTRSGFERAFGINHLGHFALTVALLDLLAASAPARVVTVASDAHFQAPGVDLDAVRRPTRSLTGMPEYAVSKLCNVLFTQELARRVAVRGVTACALHPGVVASDIWRRVPWPVRPLIKMRMLSPDDGARAVLHCVSSPGVGENSGRYYDRCRERDPSPVATAGLGRVLWERSEAWTAH